MGKHKFEFGTDFQELILKYTVTDRKGYKALELYDDSYFALIHDSVIAFALKKYYKKRKRIPEQAMLREQVRTLYTSGQRELFSALQDKDRKVIDKKINSIYNGEVADPDAVMHKIINFAKYARFKDELEKIDINKFDSYEQAITKLRAANNVGNTLEEDFGTDLVAGIGDRVHKRDQANDIHPTPIKQFNALLNSGGLEVGSLVLIASQAKRGKTAMGINIAKGLMKLGRKVLYIDYENGEKALTTRAEQSVISASHEQIVSGDMDEKLMKQLRKYRRLGGEIKIKRMVAYVNHCGDIQTFIDRCWEELGVRFTDVIIDYADLMAALSGKTDEFGRISDAYVDIKNLLEKNKFKSGWTFSHVKKEAKVRRGTKYIQEDLAKCIDKMRHADAALGLQENDDEKEQGVMRLEIMDQRQGKPDGSMYFWVDLNTQKAKEFSKSQIKEIRAQLASDKKLKREKVSDL